METATPATEQATRKPGTRVAKIRAPPFTSHRPPPSTHRLKRNLSPLKIVYPEHTLIQKLANSLKINTEKISTRNRIAMFRVVHVEGSFAGEGLPTSSRKAWPNRPL